MPALMRAMRIHQTGPMDGSWPPLALDRIETPSPGHGEVLLRVHACGVCHTEIDEIEGRTPPPRLPMTPGHQVVGTVVREGAGCSRQLLHTRVGVAWIHSACGHCPWCREGRENLCPEFRACGRDAPGGYAEYMVVPEAFAHPVPDAIGDLEATPLLCAGAVGFRALSLCGLRTGQSLGLTGFGASGHLVLQMAHHLYPDSDILVFARSASEREFASSLGAAWTGNTTDRPPAGLDAIIDTTPAWLPVVAALEALAPGGRLVINAIRKESGDHGELARLDYDRHLWREKSVSSVANVTRRDVAECLRLAAEIPLRPHVTAYALEDANQALVQLKRGNLRGAKVLRLL
ncbi:MAG: zinc-dependent alcohol dehydrogenase family protein [Lysobacterales bacterium]